MLPITLEDNLPTQLHNIMVNNGLLSPDSDYTPSLIAKAFNHIDYILLDQYVGNNPHIPKPSWTAWIVYNPEITNRIQKHDKYLESVLVGTATIDGKPIPVFYDPIYNTTD